MRTCIVGADAIGGLFAGWLGSRSPAGEMLGLVRLMARVRGLA